MRRRTTCAARSIRLLTSAATRLALLVLFGIRALAGDDLSALSADRMAIERVYYEHRLGNKPPFEQLLPPAQIEKLVAQDRRKEAVLRTVYGAEITAAMVAAESARMDATTRAPDVLAELKTALGSDPTRFARTVAKPIVVESELRARFENDDALHAAQRRQAVEARDRMLAVQEAGASVEKLLALLTSQPCASQSGAEVARTPDAGARYGEATSARSVWSASGFSAAFPAPDRSSAPGIKERGALLSGVVNQVTWQLAARPPEQGKPDEVEVQKRFGSNAQIISPPADLKEAKSYFEDLQPELQRVLRVQLQKPGDVSAVIETPTTFLLFLATDKTDTTLGTASLTISKRSYEQWLAGQTDTIQTNATASK